MRHLPPCCCLVLLALASVAASATTDPAATPWSHETRDGEAGADANTTQAPAAPREHTAPTRAPGAEAAPARSKDATASAPATAKPRPGDRIQLAQAPEAVRKTIAREAGGRDVTSLAVREEFGRVVYDARIPREDADHPLRLKVAEDGGLVWRNDLMEQARAERSAAGASTSDGEHAQERKPAEEPAAPAPRPEPAAGAQSGSNAGSAPAIAERQPDAAPAHGELAIEQLPGPVKTTLVRESDGRSISDIRLKRERGRNLYQAKLRDPQGKTQRIVIGEDGAVVARK
jgi:uncharacterized membrane protein YkoI